MNSDLRAAIIIVATFCIVGALSLLTYPLFVGVERRAFEESYQYNEAQRNALSTFQAEKIRLQALVNSSALSEEQRAYHRAALRAVEFQISALQHQEE